MIYEDASDAKNITDSAISELVAILLSGTFFSVERLPEFIQKITFFNPFFHMIDGFRFAFIGNADGSLNFGIPYLFILSIVIWFLAYLLYKKGYKIRSWVT